MLTCRVHMILIDFLFALILSSIYMDTIFPSWIWTNFEKWSHMMKCQPAYWMLLMCSVFRKKLSQIFQACLEARSCRENCPHTYQYVSALHVYILTFTFVLKILCQFLCKKHTLLIVFSTCTGKFLPHVIFVFLI